ncbi:hypothetical protein S40288_03820 [Stachybotrys chartarum IBT 40288]|nr:hypothetical protein S40288_03820 [Stachybotrys chartarum IBT 40288]
MSSSDFGLARGSDSGDGGQARGTYNRLNLIRVDVAPLDAKLQDIRNFVTIQSAILRGEEDVTLLNADRIPDNLIRSLRVPWSLAHNVESEYSPPWAEWHDSSARGPRAHPSNGYFREFKKHNTFAHLDLKYQGILGQGGFGFVTRWRATFADGTGLDFALKSGPNFDLTYNAAGERWWHDRYKGATHTVQTVDLEAIAAEKRERAGVGRAQGVESFNPLRYNALFLEFADQGDFESIVAKIHHDGILVTNRIAWHIWENLVTGLASMAWIPSYAGQSPDFDRCVALAQEGEDDHLQNIFWSVNPEHDVHFDMDESNILVAYDSTRKAPILKFHDFSDEWSVEMKRQWGRWPNSRYWDARYIGKIHRFAPEQVHQDWDKVTPNRDGPPCPSFAGENFESGERVAGRYGTWTNIFVTAKIMEAFITGARISHPFKAKQVTTSDDRTFSSYGYRLQSFKNDHQDHVEVELIDTIMKCQAEFPRDRPSVGRLLGDVVERLKKPFAESDEQFAQFWSLFLRTPTPAKPPSPPPPPPASTPSSGRGGDGDGDDDESGGPDEDGGDQGAAAARRATPARGFAAGRRARAARGGRPRVYGARANAGRGRAGARGARAARGDRNGPAQQRDEAAPREPSARRPALGELDVVDLQPRRVLRPRRQQRQRQQQQPPAPPAPSPPAAQQPGRVLRPRQQQRALAPAPARAAVQRLRVRRRPPAVVTPPPQNENDLPRGQGPAGNPRGIPDSRVQRPPLGELNPRNIHERVAAGAAAAVRQTAPEVQDPILLDLAQRLGPDSGDEEEDQENRTPPPRRLGRNIRGRGGDPNSPSYGLARGRGARRDDRHQVVVLDEDPTPPGGRRAAQQGGSQAQGEPSDAVPNIPSAMSSFEIHEDPESPPRQQPAPPAQTSQSSSELSVLSATPELGSSDSVIGTRRIGLPRRGAPTPSRHPMDDLEGVVVGEDDESSETSSTAQEDQVEEVAQVQIEEAVEVREEQSSDSKGEQVVETSSSQETVLSTIVVAATRPPPASSGESTSDENGSSGDNAQGSPKRPREEDRDEDSSESDVSPPPPKRVRGTKAAPKKPAPKKVPPKKVPPKKAPPKTAVSKPAGTQKRSRQDEEEEEEESSSSDEESPPPPKKSRGNKQPPAAKKPPAKKPPAKKPAAKKLPAAPQRRNPARAARAPRK